MKTKISCQTVSQHEWKCTQVAGEFKCEKCKKKAFWNRFTQQKEIV